MLHPSTFEYLKPTEDQLARMTRVRAAFATCAAAVNVDLPEGADKVHVMKSLQATAMWANVSITRHADGAPREPEPAFPTPPTRSRAQLKPRALPAPSPSGDNEESWGEWRVAPMRYNGSDRATRKPSIALTHAPIARFPHGTMLRAQLRRRDGAGKVITAIVKRNNNYWFFHKTRLPRGWPNLPNDADYEVRFAPMNARP